MLYGKHGLAGWQALIPCAGDRSGQKVQGIRWASAWSEGQHGSLEILATVFDGKLQRKKEEPIDANVLEIGNR